MGINAPTIKQVYWVEDKATGTLKKIRTEESKVAQSMGKVDKKSKTLAKSLGGVATGLTAVAVAGASLKFLKDSIVTFAKFEAQMNKTRAVSGASAKEMQQLTEQAKDLGANTALSASNVGELQFELSKLGFTVEQIVESTDDVGALSLALGHDLADSASIAGKTLRQFGLEAEEMGRVVDNIAQGASSSALDITSFSEAMKFAGGTAGQLGFDIEETTASIGLLANVGISGTLAGTGLNRVLLDLTDSSSKVSKYLQDFTGDAGDLQGMLQNLNEDGLSANEIFNIFGKVAGKSALALIRNAEAVGELEEGQRKSNERAKEMTKIMEEGLLGQSQKLASAFESLQISIGASFGDSSITAMKLFTKSLGGMKWFVEHLSGQAVTDAIDKQLELSATFNTSTSAMFKARGALIELNKIESESTLTGLKRADAIMLAKNEIKAVTGSLEKLTKVNGEYLISGQSEEALRKRLQVLMRGDIKTYDELQTTIDETAEKAKKKASLEEESAKALAIFEAKEKADAEAKRKQKAEQLAQASLEASQIAEFQKNKLEGLKVEELTEQQIVDFKKSKYEEQIAYEKSYLETREMWRQEDLQAMKDTEQKKRDEQMATASLAVSSFNTIGSAFSQLMSMQISEIQAKAQADINAVNNKDKKLTSAERKKQKEINKIKNDANADAHKFAVADWVAQGLQIASAGALATVQALTLGPIAGPLAASLTGAAVLAQVGVHGASMPKEPPKLARGAFVSGSSAGTNVIVGEAGDEEIFGMGSQGVPRRQQFASEVASMVSSNSGGGNTYNITVNESATPQLTARAVYDLIDEGERLGMAR